MHWSTILLRYSVTDGVVNALHDLGDNILQQLEVHSCTHRFHNKGTESPTIPPSKMALNHNLSIHRCK